eukprot:gnl/TRDRNA2_/TRDRNA2_174417_c1_seq28.p1 gnl/TRDRNA2_/TRDRNA2_174417_c1~~gnl/TRDRNA2_/TRDRNA2_174417_c1_seq28.p1  ORF type:complete len:185 (-),score=43.66 gnl/TRDRNA2_/TRDRNA2_174417_c1_seq28:42-596(-)
MKATCVIAVAILAAFANSAVLRSNHQAELDAKAETELEETSATAMAIEALSPNPPVAALKAEHPLTDVGKDQWPTKHDPRSLNPPAAHKEAAKGDKLLPIGEGAYQDPEAVAQRTLDSSVRCEKTQANTDAIVDCWKEKGDYLDGHVYGNYQHPKAAPPPVKAGAAATGLGMAVAALTAISLRM